MPNPYFSFTYGLFWLSACSGGRHNACIVNTAGQITANRLTLSVNRSNLTCDYLLQSGRFALSVLTQEAPFELFRRFGMQSGREADKLAGFADAVGTGDGLLRLCRWSNAYFTCRVVSCTPCDTHVLIVAEVEDAVCLAPGLPLSYAYYQANIKPAAPAAKGWRCRVCGHVLSSDTLPPDYVCPICKHGATDFERVE